MLEQALAERRSVAEGLTSAPAVRALAERLGVDMPVCRAVAQVVAAEIEVGQAIEGLLARPPEDGG